MSTEDMPTTNQGPQDATLADKIPPTIADGFKQAASTAVGMGQKMASSGMSM